MKRLNNALVRMSRDVSKGMTLIEGKTVIRSCLILYLEVILTPDPHIETAARMIVALKLS